MLNRIIQWNCRGLKANDEETILLLKDYEPAALRFQETGVVGWCDGAGQTSSAGASYLFGL